MKRTVMLARFPGNFSEHPDSVDWVMDTAFKMRAKPGKVEGSNWSTNSAISVYNCDHPEIDRLILWRASDTPIDMVRNRCVADAQRLGVDYLLMIDSDMHPDEYVLHGKPFWETAWEFMLGQKEPSVIAAPYVGPEQHQNIYVFRWRNKNNLDVGDPRNMALEQFTREEASERGGIEQVAALPTGLILYDMRVFERMVDPYFYYEFDPRGTKKQSTEDVTNTRDISLAWADVPGAGCYCAWDCWAEHIKLRHFGKPVQLTNDMVGRTYRQAILRGRSQHEQVKYVRDEPGKGPWSEPSPLTMGFRPVPLSELEGFEWAWMEYNGQLLGPCTAGKIRANGNYKHEHVFVKVSDPESDAPGVDGGAVVDGGGSSAGAAGLDGGSIGSAAGSVGGGGVAVAELQDPPLGGAPAAVAEAPRSAGEAGPDQGESVAPATDDVILPDGYCIIPSHIHEGLYFLHSRSAGYVLKKGFNAGVWYFDSAKEAAETAWLLSEAASKEVAS